MTIDDLQFYINVKKPLEFIYKGKIYSLNYDKDINGKEYIRFGLLYEEQKYDSYGEFINSAMIENHFLKEMLEQF